MLTATGAAAAAAGIGVVTISRTAQRTTAASADLTIDGDSVTVRNGTIEAVTLAATATWEYDLPSGERPSQAVVELQAGDGLEAIETATSDATFLESDGEETFSVDLLVADVVSADTIRPETGGETIETTIPVGVAFEVIDEGGAVIASDTVATDATVSVTQSDYDPSEYGGVAGAGELTVELA
jgi:hypothetical protein